MHQIIIYCKSKQTNKNSNETIQIKNFKIILTKRFRVKTGIPFNYVQNFRILLWFVFLYSRFHKK